MTSFFISFSKTRAKKCFVIETKRKKVRERKKNMSQHPFDVPVNRDFVRERNRMVEYNRTYTLHQRTNFNAGRALLVEVVPSGTPVQSVEHEVARSNVIDELARHFFHLPANGRFKHVYFNTTNPDEDPNPIPTPPIDINEILLDEVYPARTTEVNTLIGAILKLLHKNDAKFEYANDIDQKLKHAYDLSKADAPEGAFNDLLCDNNLGIKYFYDKLKHMFVSGGFFLAICDCDAANERATMRIRASMLVTYEEPVGLGAGAGAIPEKLDDVVRDIRARLRNEKRDTKKYVTQRALPAFETYPHALGRYILEAICVYKVPDLSGRSMDVFDFAQARDPTKVIEVITGQVCLQFLDAYACLNGVPEIKLESVLRSLDKSHVQKNEFVFAPETNEPMPDFFQVGDWVRYHLTNTEWHTGVVDELQPDNLKMLVRRWDPTVGDFYRDMDNVYVYMFDDRNRFFADICPGQRVNFRTGTTRRAKVKPGVVQGITPNHDEWIVRDDDGKNEHVSYYIKKIRGTTKNKLAYLHEYYYYLGYDFEESETLFSLFTLRPLVTYPNEAWYDPRNVPSNRTLYTGAARPNLDPDHKDLRLGTLFARQHPKTPIFPVQAGGKVPVPDAYVHPVETNPPENKIDAVATRMNNPLIPMVRRVTGVYKPRGEVIHKISLPGLDGKPQPDWRHMQSTVLQSVATDQSNAVCKEAWRFKFGVLNDPRALNGIPLGLTAGALRAQTGAMSQKTADRVRAAIAVGTAHLQQVLFRQKQETIQRNIARVVLKKNLKRLVDEKRRSSKVLKSAFQRFLLRRLLAKRHRMRTSQAQEVAQAAAEAILPEHEPAPVLTPQRSNELVRTSSSPKRSELERAVSVTLPSRSSTSSSTTTTAPTLGMSMSYDQFMSMSASNNASAGLGQAQESSNDDVMRSVPEHIARMLDQIRKVQRSKNLGAFADYDDMRRRAMAMLEDEHDLPPSVKERVIQEFHLRIREKNVPEQNALVLFTPANTTPVLIPDTNVAIGTLSANEGDEEKEEVVPPSRTGARPILFDQELHGMPRERAEQAVPAAVRGALLEDVRSMCDSLFTRLQNMQGEYADKGEKWFVRGMRAFLKLAKEYFKVLRPIVSGLPRGTVSHAIRVFEDVETIAVHLGTRITTLKELKSLVNKLMDKITSMDETQNVIQHFVDHTNEEEAWMYEAQGTSTHGRKRVVDDDDDSEGEELVPPHKKQIADEEAFADQIFQDEPVQEVVFEIDDDAPTPPHLEDDNSDVIFVSDSKQTTTTKFGKTTLQSVRRRTRLAR